MFVIEWYVQRVCVYVFVCLLLHVWKPTDLSFLMLYINLLTFCFNPSHFFNLILLNFSWRTCCTTGWNLQSRSRGTKVSSWCLHSQYHPWKCSKSTSHLQHSSRSRRCSYQHFTCYLHPCPSPLCKHPSITCQFGLLHPHPCFYGYHASHCWSKPYCLWF